MDAGNDAWVSLRVDCSAGEADSVCAIVEISDALSYFISNPDSDFVTIEALYDVDDDRLPSLLNSLEALQHSHRSVRFSQKLLNDRDWVQESQQNLNPVEVGSNLRIVAPWHKAEAVEKLTVIINPGTAFGTGHHESTFLCANFLSELDLDGSTVIDYGCGSGVLAIAALRLGAKTAWGVDNDKTALENCLENAMLNDVEHALKICLPGEVPNNLSADVVVANIFADALIELNGKLTELTRPGGWLILSGILKPQASRVLDAYDHSFQFSVEVLGDWVVLKGRRTIEDD